MNEETTETAQTNSQGVLEGAHTLEQRFLGIGDAAIYAGLSKESIRRMVAAGKLTALRPVRGRVLIDRRQLDCVVLGAVARPRRGRGAARPLKRVAGTDKEPAAEPVSTGLGQPDGTLGSQEWPTDFPFTWPADLSR